MFLKTQNFQNFVISNRNSILSELKSIIRIRATFSKNSLFLGVLVDRSVAIQDAVCMILNKIWDLDYLSSFS